ncbi:hypothetical protein [Maribellus maritimus]|uniref:hypothetical protein n=1 Tax=Maribellus maritimus TaxID=2870838 RepID=UPI001EECA7C2|nr:hypothetical protein [Maribellus maritimus]MCG6188902.1 hypothetical protein [Maribellus maritimus]
MVVKLLIILLPLLLFCNISISQNVEFEEIPVTLRVEGVGATNLDPLYSYDVEKLFLPVLDVFHLLQIKAESSLNMDRISGFMADESNKYMIDNINKQVFANGKTYNLEVTDLIKTEFGLYLDHQLWGELFGLYCDFNFRSLTVNVKPGFEVPAIREMRLKQFRENVNILKGEEKVDTSINRDYHFLKFGMVDWAVSSTQSTAQYNDTRIWLGTGAELFGGETSLLLNYSSRDGFNNRNQQYYWRWVNNQAKMARQIRIGKISSSAIASIYDPLIGMSITNAPTTYRRSFGEYTINDYTEPGWTVELYVNNVIVDYQTADASGFYSFNVPLVYGTSQVRLKFYGPYGEERTKEEFLNIPFNFLPAGEMEYTLSSGIVMDGDYSRFGRAEVKYGVSRFLTIGGGIEYLSSIANGDKIPFFLASVTPFPNFMLTGEYADGVRTKALVNYRLASGPMLELNYVLYDKEQQAIRLNYLEERGATLSVPLNFKFLNGYTRWSFKQNVYEMLTYNTADVTFSSFFGNVNTNISAYANWLGGRDPYIYSNLGLGIRLGHGFTVRPQSQVDITNKDITSVKAEVEKRIARSGYLSVSGEENFRSSYRSLQFSFRWDFSFSQVNFSARVSNNEFLSTQGARGSFAFGGGNGYIHKDNRSAIGRCGIAVVPFVDIDHDGFKDSDEPFAQGLSIGLRGGRTLKNLQDSIIRVVGLEPYTSYVLTLDDKGLEQISWQLEHKSYRIYTDPNQFKKVYIPVLPMGEVNGWVYLNDDRGEKGQGRIVVNFYNADGEMVASTMTERDGGFTFLGLPPGQYYAEVDRAQLESLKMKSVPVKTDFTIKPMAIGDIVYDIQFVIQRISEDIKE